MTARRLEPKTAELVNRHSTSWSKWLYGWAALWVLISSVHLTVSFYHVTYAFLSESTLYICLNVRKLLARTKGDIWSLSDSNGSRAHKHLICKWTLNLLAEPTEWLSRILSTYLYRAFDCMFLSCHVQVWEWIHTLYLPDCRGTSCSKQTRYLQFKWLERDSNPQLLSL